MNKLGRGVFLAPVLAVNLAGRGDINFYPQSESIVISSFGSPRSLIPAPYSLSFDSSFDFRDEHNRVLPGTQKDRDAVKALFWSSAWSLLMERGTLPGRWRESLMSAASWLAPTAVFMASHVNRRLALIASWGYRLLRRPALLPASLARLAALAFVFFFTTRLFSARMSFQKSAIALRL